MAVSTYIFRTIEDANVDSRPRNVPFSDANLFLGGRMYSVGTRLSEVMVEQEREIGHASACAVGHGAAPSGGACAVLRGVHLPRWSQVFAAQGSAQVTSADVPDTGVVLAGCALRVVSGPPDCVGGAASSLSIFNPEGKVGAGTGSFWTLRAYFDKED